ncbi:MAG: ABC transporter permease [Saprospiraceae bacterium]|nr:ABC transporter permease [Saprospiraceae bacterium]
MNLHFSFRHLMRQKMFTALNILGLAVGMSACWIVYLVLRHELSFEKGIPERDRIYHVVSRFIFDGEESGNAGAPKPLYDALRDEVPGIDLCVPEQDIFVESVAIPMGEGIPPRIIEMQRRVVKTTGEYFQLVPYTWLAGNPADFNAPGKVVLTTERLHQYFPNMRPDQVLGRSFTYNDTLLVTVCGVVENLDFPSDFNGLEFVTMGTFSPLGQYHKMSWAGVNSNDQIFIKVSPGADVAQMEATINRISAERSAEGRKFWGDNSRRWHVLQPLSDVHFNGDYVDNRRKANMTVLYGLMGVAGFLLLLACINFINLATAQMPQRARELGIRKTLGSGSSALIAQFLAETMLTGVFALGFALGLVYLFLKNFDDFIPEGVSAGGQLPQTLLFLAGLLIVVSLLAGLYPAWLATRVQPVRILRGQPMVAIGKQRVTLRKGLIVFQFTAAQLFMLGALVVGLQLRYVLTQDLGFNRDAILTASMPFKVQVKDTDNNRRFTLRDELLRLPGVAGVSLGQPPVSFSYSANVHELVGAPSPLEMQISRKFIDTSYIRLYGLKLLAGRNLMPSDTVTEYVINAACAQALGFKEPSEAIGRYLLEKEGTPVPIVGVISDFHSTTFMQKIEPMALMTDKSSLSDFNIKLAGKNPDDWPKVMAEIGAIWTKIYPEEAIEAKFYDETLAELYEQERQLARMINLIMAVAVLISCLGLFGLATLTAFQRTKEVGVRKVLGASAVSVVALLSKDFIRLVLIALVIAAPVAWWLMQQWLQTFAYRIDLHFWMIAAVGTGAVLLAFLTVSFQSIRAALADPVRSLRSE